MAEAGGEVRAMRGTISSRLPSCFVGVVEQLYDDYGGNTNIIIAIDGYNRCSNDCAACNRNLYILVSTDVNQGIDPSQKRLEGSS